MIQYPYLYPYRLYETNIAKFKNDTHSGIVCLALTPNVRKTKTNKSYSENVMKFKRVLYNGNTTNV